MEAVQNQLSALNRGHMVKQTSEDNDWIAGCPCSLQNLMRMPRSCTKYCQVMASFRTRGEESKRGALVNRSNQNPIPHSMPISYLLPDIVLSYKAPSLAWTSQSIIKFFVAKIERLNPSRSSSERQFTLLIPCLPQQKEDSNKCILIRSGDVLHPTRSHTGPLRQH